MTTILELGKTSTTLHKFLYTWVIDNFMFCISGDTNDILHSSNFSIEPEQSLDNENHANTNCSKNSQSHQQVKSFLQLHTRYPTSDDPTLRFEINLVVYQKNKVNCRFFIKDKLGNRCFEKEQVFDKFEKNCTNLYFSKDVFVHEFFDQENDFLSNGSLTVCCETAIMVNRSIQKIESPPQVMIQPRPRHLLLDSLFLNEEFADVWLCTGSDTKLPAHRAVLAAGSSVFRDMFDHKMLEKNKGVVTIHDTDIELLRELLRYIYTGKVKSLQYHALDLLSLADKYALPDLLRMCEDALAANLQPNNVLEVLLVAERHKLFKLKQDTLILARERMYEIMKTSISRSSRSQI